jgi:hypothetical protein
MSGAAPLPPSSRSNSAGMSKPFLIWLACVIALYVTWKVGVTFYSH